MSQAFRALAAVSLCVGPALADGPSLTVPASDQVLHFAAPIPEGFEARPESRWRLVGGSDEPVEVLADVRVAVDPDGLPSAGRRVLVASIPPGGDEGVRRFLLEPLPAEPGRGGTRAFRFGDVDAKGLGLWEGDRPVLVYNHGIRSKPGVPSERDRSTYVHPIHGLDGEVLTDDFPEDHLHHRGLFWAWPHVVVDGQEYDLWLGGTGIEQRFERWLAREAGAASAVLGVENGWYVGDRKVMTERVWLTVRPATDDARAIDVDCYWTPTEGPVTLAGAEGKSYGGLTLRFAPRTETAITTPDGTNPDDLLVTRMPWADLTARFAGALGPSGAAVFVGRDHPDFPPEWMTRHYGALCVGWPGVEAQTLEPGKTVHGPYRLWIHRGQVDASRLGAVYDAFGTEDAASWEGVPDGAPTPER